jgi:hypothetical protein
MTLFFSPRNVYSVLQFPYNFGVSTLTTTIICSVEENLITYCNTLASLTNLKICLQKHSNSMHKIFIPHHRKFPGILISISNRS